MVSEGDAVYAALVAMVPEEIREHLGPAELAVRVNAAWQVMADAELKGIDKKVGLGQARKILESVSLTTYLKVAGAIARLAEISSDSAADSMRNDLHQLTARNPAVRVFFGLPQETRLAILAEISPAETVKPSRRKRFKWKFWSRDNDG